MLNLILMAFYIMIYLVAKNKKPYMHMSMSLLGKKIFCVDRDTMTTMTKETESWLYGMYIKEELVLRETWEM